MSFTFNWPRFSDQFHYDAIQMLNNALNKGNKPPVIADKIEVVELEMGTQPPELEIRDIGDLTEDHFRGIFRLTYSGDAHLVLKTKVQANPLNHKQPDIHLMTGSSGMLAAKHPLVVPMLLRLSHFRLNSYVVLVVSKQKGITLVFKTDPLQNVDINSTFDSIAVIQNFIQREIEGQLRQMFREDLPGIIHRLSQQWVKAKVEAPYLSKRPPPPAVRRMFQTVSTPGSVVGSTSPSEPSGSGAGGPRLSRKSSSNSLGSRRARSTAGTFDSTDDQANYARAASSSSPDPQNEFDNFDPTYGLRPEGLPTKSGFKGFSSLFGKDKGLADLAEEEGSEYDDYEDEGTSYDVVEWEDTVRSLTPPQSVYNDKEPSPEYETIPAVGGGTITRPRVFHSQSSIQLHNSSGSSMSKSLSSLPPMRPGSQGPFSRSGSVTPALLLPRLPHSASNPYFAGFTPTTSSSRRTSGSFRSTSANPPFSAYTAGRSGTPDSVDSRSQPSRSSTGPSASTSSPLTDHTTPEDDLESTHSAAIYLRRPPERRMSITSTTTTNDMAFTSSSPPSHFAPLDQTHHHHQQDPKIVLRPTLNNSIHQLSTLSHSNHTLSPYTRDVSHFTVRSVPPRAQSGLGHSTSLESRQPVKARRKRTYRLGGKKQQPPEAANTPIPPTPLGSDYPGVNDDDEESLFRHPLSVAGDEDEFRASAARYGPSLGGGGGGPGGSSRRGTPLQGHPPHRSQPQTLRHQQRQQHINDVEYARQSSTSPIPPSELGFDVSDRDRYFRMMTADVSPNQTIRPGVIAKLAKTKRPFGGPSSLAVGLGAVGGRLPTTS